MIKIDKKVVGFAVVGDDDRQAESQMESMEGEDVVLPDIDNLLTPIRKPNGMQQSFTVREPLVSVAYGKLEPIVTIGTIPVSHIKDSDEFKTLRVSELYAAQDDRAEIAGWKELSMRLSSLCIKQGVSLSKVVRQWSKITGEDNIRVKTPYGKTRSTSHEIAAMGAVIHNSLYELGFLTEEGLDVPYHKLPRLQGEGILGALVKPDADEPASNLKLVDDAEQENGDSFPENAQLCVKCTTKAVVKLDGCMTCLNCGDSKCG